MKFQGALSDQIPPIDPPLPVPPLEPPFPEPIPIDPPVPPFPQPEPTPLGPQPAEIDDSGARYTYRPWAYGPSLRAGRSAHTVLWSLAALTRTSRQWRATSSI